MILKQCYLGCLAQASYFIADEKAGVAAVVDPRRDVEEYLEEAARLGVKIRHVILTHIHADFLAGHLELRERTGAEIHLGARATADYPFTPHADGDVLVLGDVRLRFLETPGHTPESISVVVEHGGKTHAVLTGDTLFIGDVGRPDLLASVGVTAEELAGQLYDSLHRKLLALPDETILYPGHGAGSACGKSMSEETVSTIGAQRRSNYALKFQSRGEFVKSVTSEQPEAPPYFAYDADLNRRERATLDANLKKALTPLDIEAVLRRANAGAQLLDVREPEEFAAGFLADSVNVPLSGKYATYCGTVLDRARPIILIAEPGREREAVMRLGRIGFDNVAGYLEGGPASVEPALGLTRTFESLGPAAAAERLQTATLVDVRTAREFREKRIDGAVNIPLQQFERRMNELAGDRPLLVYCRTGHRSSIAISLRERRGASGAANLAGGIEAWQAAGLEVAR